MPIPRSWRIHNLGTGHLSIDSLVKRSAVGTELTDDQKQILNIRVTVTIGITATSVQAEVGKNIQDILDINRIVAIDVSRAVIATAAIRAWSLKIEHDAIA